jgi:hypothetical protein
VFTKAWNLSPATKRLVLDFNFYSYVPVPVESGFASKRMNVTLWTSRRQSRWAKNAHRCETKSLQLASRPNRSHVKICTCMFPQQLPSVVLDVNAKMAMYLTQFLSTVCYLKTVHAIMAAGATTRATKLRKTVTHGERIKFNFTSFLCISNVGRKNSSSSCVLTVEYLHLFYFVYFVMNLVSSEE